MFFLVSWKNIFLAFTGIFLPYFGFFLALGEMEKSSMFSFGSKKEPRISSLFDSMYNCSTSCLYFSINIRFMHVPHIFIVTSHGISMPPWTIGDCLYCLLASGALTIALLSQIPLIPRLAYFNCKQIKRVLMFMKIFYKLICLRIQNFLR